MTFWLGAEASFEAGEVHVIVDHFFRLINRPGSEEFTEVREPSRSRTVLEGTAGAPGDLVI